MVYTSQISFKRSFRKVGLTAKDVSEAEARLARFAPYLAKVFPETQAQHGKIESDIVEIAHMQKHFLQQNKYSLMEHSG